MKTPKIPGALIGCAGEHFVAYRLSAMGYLVALTRSGAPFVDLMVGTADGHNTVTIQVKTRDKALQRATKTHPPCWEWPIQNKGYHGESAFYAFVDLNGGTGEKTPDVFIVPADVVVENISEAFPKNAKDERTTWVSVWGKPPESPMYFFHIEADENRKEKEEKWREAWHLIKSALGVAKDENGIGRK